MNNHENCDNQSILSDITDCFGNITISSDEIAQKLDEQVVVANSLVGEQAEQFRRAAWSALEFPARAAVRVIPAQAVRPVPLPQRRLPSQRSRRRPVPEELNERVA